MLPTPDFGYDDNVYEPAEDSFLLLDCMEDQKAFLEERTKVPVVCEIGTGSGVVTAFVKKHILPHGIFLATDVNPHACRAARGTLQRNGCDGASDVLQGSLASAIRGVVDVLMFNPPYVPAGEVPERPEVDDDGTWLDLALLGGADGMVVTNEVLDQMDDILSATGVAYILFCARNHPDRVAEVWRERGWDVDIVAHRKAGWEVLSVMRFARRK